MKTSRSTTGATRARTTTRRPEGRRPALKRFGQHFLEPAWVDKLVRVIAPTSSQTFLEIGPGAGALTRPLASAAGRVVAFEIDRGLAADLRAMLLPNVSVVEGDVLAQRLGDIRAALGPDPAGALRAAGNLPYNVASPILFRLVEFYAAGLPLVDATVMLQREVADRLLARPGSRDYGVLAILLGRWADLSRVLALPPGAFRPMPRVHSTVVTLRFRAPEPAAADERVLQALVQAVFTRRRKTLANALLAFGLAGQVPPAAALAEAHIDARRRPETLEAGEFVALADVFARHTAVDPPKS